jgi:hypothetical protein
MKTELNREDKWFKRERHTYIAIARILSYVIIINMFSFMQGIHTHIPEKNHVPGEYIVAAILSLLFMVPLSVVPALALLFLYVSTFRSMCAVPNMAAFCSSLMSWLPGMLFTYFLNYFEMVAAAPIIADITLAFTFHMRSISCEVFIF